MFNMLHMQLGTTNTRNKQGIPTLSALLEKRLVWTQICFPQASIQHDHCPKARLGLTPRKAMCV